MGYDFHFGRDREGSMRMLTELGPRLGFSVTIIPEVVMGDGDVNSTRIRELLAKGERRGGRALLGRDYTVRGRVVQGDARGRTLGFPTANLAPENEVLPAAGVYAGLAALLDAGDPPAGTTAARRHQRRHAADLRRVGSRGRRGPRDRLLAATSTAGASSSRFRFHLRPERRFAGVEALRAQIETDRSEARRRLAAG